MDQRYFRNLAAQFLTLSIFAASATGVSAERLVRNFSGIWTIQQSNGFVLDFEIAETGDGKLSGKVSYLRNKDSVVGRPFEAREFGTLTGRAGPKSFNLTVNWERGTAGEGE